VAPKTVRVVLNAAVVAILLAVVTHTRADPDLFGNIRFGHDVVDARSAVVADHYSFTSQPVFMNHEWLFQAIAFVVFRFGGSAGLIALKLLLIAALLAAVRLACASAGVPPPAQLMLAGLVVVGTFPQTNQVRAQLCSLALLGWLLVVLLEARRRPSMLAALPPIMIAWANLHGGWIVGAGCLAAWYGAGVLAPPSRRASVVGLAAAAVAIAATVVNPFEWHLWQFVYETVGFNRAEIADWQPVFRIGWAYGVLWLLTAAVASIAVARGIERRALDLQAAAVVAMLAAGSFRVNRLLAFFTIAVVMLLGPEVAAWFARPRAASPAHRPSRVAVAATFALALVVVIGGGAAAASNVSCIRMEARTFPEPQVASLVSRYGLHGRMLTWFDYGHYAIWYFSPAIKVSMDGRRETVYSSDTIQRQLRFYYRPEERRALLAELQPDYIWLPRHVAVVEPLLADGWQPVFEGPQSLVLAQHQPADNGPIEMTNAERCFPGP